MALGAEVIVQVQKPLVELFSSMNLPVTLIAKGEPLPEFDAFCPLMSLPYAFKTSLETMTPPMPYLFANQGKVSAWERRLGARNRFRVGLVWSGSSNHKNDHNRSLTLQQLLPHLPDCCEYVSLQKEVRETDKQVLTGIGIKHHGEELKDFADTAALCELMDLVISVDTSVVHLAGAMGKQAWLLLPHIPDFRWLLDRDDSPWYPTVRLFRQDERREWLPVLDRVKNELLGISQA